jgi:hypothetical protein
VIFVSLFEKVCVSGVIISHNRTVMKILVFYLYIFNTNICKDTYQWDNKIILNVEFLNLIAFIIVQNLFE